MKPHDPIEEITRIAEVFRKSGPVALGSMEISDPFLAQGVRSIADGYDRAFIRAATECDGDDFWMHLDEGSKIYRAFGDCAGVPDDRFASVTGKADTEPMFPDDPYSPANRRVTVTLPSEAPPTPAGKGLPQAAGLSRTARPSPSGTRPDRARPLAPATPAARRRD